MVFEPHHSIGEIESVQQFKDTGWSAIIHGWCSGAMGAQRMAHLYVAGIKIRSQHASGEGTIGQKYFTFYIGRNTLAKLPSNAPIKITIGETSVECEFADGVARTIDGESDDEGQELQSMLDGAFHLDHWGNLHKPFGKNPELIDKLLGFYDQWRGFFEAKYGKKLFMVGGNLLGLVREGKFLDHDDDLDVGIAFPATTSQAAVDQFFDFFEKVAAEIKEMGFQIKLMNVGHFQIVRPQDSAVLDLFLCWITPEGYYYRYLGVGGRYGSDTIGTVETEYKGIKVYLPGKPETELELAYGPNWKVPDPNFVWRVSDEIKAVFDQSTKYGWKRYKALSNSFPS